jgi:YVTN family beta-propeller protein
MSAPSTTDNRLAFAILGPLRVTRSGAAVALGGRQQRAILARLLVAGAAGVSVDQLADMLWSGRAPSGFVTTIQTYVFHLRKLLEPERGRGTPGAVLVTENGRYRLAVAPDAVDVGLFKRAADAGQQLLAAGNAASAATELRRGLGLWRGEVLADLADFEFVAPFAARLNEQRLVAIEAAIDCELLAGHHAAVIGELDELIAQHPLREQLYERRMLALYRAGRQAEALNSFDRLRGQLRDELGVDPGEPLQRLQRQVLTHDPALDVHPAAATDQSDAGVTPSPTLVTDSEPGSDRQPPRRPRYRQRRWVIGSCAVILAAAVAATTAVVVSQTQRSSLRTLPPSSVGVIDADGSLHDAVAVGQSPDGIVYGFNSLWVANSEDGTVQRVNPHTREVVQTIRVGASPTAVAVAGNDVWVVNSAVGTVSKIDPKDNTVASTVSVGALPTAIAAGPSGVWVANSGDDTVQRIDPITGIAGRAFDVGDGPDGLAVDEHSVWVANGREGTLSHLDAATGQPLGPSVAVGSGAKGLALTPDAVWVANEAGLSVTRVDVTTGLITQIQVGDGPHAIVSAAGKIWASDEYAGTITEIDPASNNRVLHNYATGSSPRGLAVAGSSLWVSTAAFTGTGHRGGTLVIGALRLPGHWTGIDPANVYTYNDTTVAERPVYDGLVAYRVTNGAAGLTLVPDLATTLPRPTNGGKTYSFVMRPGIRYSNGATMHASDIRRGVQRELTIGVNGNPAFFYGIVGAKDCHDDPKTCDQTLTRGIQVEDATGRITFRLIGPDPDFLYKLTYFAVATAPGAPTTDSQKPLPGTGPYMIAAYTKDKELLLKRNPYFKQWSFAAQPAGYPDFIRWRVARTADSEMHDVLAGRSDVLAGWDITADADQYFSQHYPAQIRRIPLFQLGYVTLNTRIPPFNDVNVRRAINDAIDRRTIAAKMGGSAHFVPTCQILPQGFPAYQYYCPYASPDFTPQLATANSLVKASGTSGMAISVFGPNDHSRLDRVTHYVAAVLMELGYRPVVREGAPGVSTLLAIGNPRNRIQVGVAVGVGCRLPGAVDVLR